MRDRGAQAASLVTRRPQTRGGSKATWVANDVAAGAREARRRGDARYVGRDVSGMSWEVETKGMR